MDTIKISTQVELDKLSYPLKANLDLRKWSDHDVNLSGVTVEGNVDLRKTRVKGGVNLSKATVKGNINLSKMIASYVSLDGATVGSADLFRAIVGNVNLPRTSINYARLVNMIVDYIDWSKSFVRGGVNLFGARVNGDVVLSTASISGVELSSAIVRGNVNLYSAYVSCNMNLSKTIVRGTVNLLGALVEGNICLSGAILRGNIHLASAIVQRIFDNQAPKISSLDAKILAAIENGGHLKMNNWHTCATTHCRAGWAVTVAGKAGLNLEKRLGTAGAAAALYTSAGLPIPNFYNQNNDKVLAQIKGAANAQR